MSVKDRMIEIQNKMMEAKSSVGAFQDDAFLIAVSKKQSLETIREAVDAGLRHFGENYLQEALEKQESLQLKSVQWHFIGSIQSKKVKLICENFDWVHSVDRLKVAEAVNKACEGLSKKPKILIQLNLADEDSKSGLSEKEFWSFLEDVSGFENVVWSGLMLMPPFVNKPEENRPLFARAKDILAEAKERFSFLDSEEFVHLSMGTSQDYQVAIEEGATMVRVGTSLLGEREH